MQERNRHETVRMDAPTGGGFAGQRMRRTGRLLGGTIAVLLAAGATVAGEPSGGCEPHWDGVIGQPGMDGESVTNTNVTAMTIFNDGSGRALYAGGRFTSAGGVTVSNIAKWDGAAWSPLGSGMSGDFTHVHALAVFDDRSGGGPALYAGGSFTSVDGTTANNIAKWDGAVWSPLGSGMNGSVLTLTVFDDGSGEGPALYAGGWFTAAGGVPVSRVAKWDGTAWSAVGSGMSIFVRALAVFDDGSGGGPALYAGGTFFMASGIPVNNIAKWNGTAWSSLGSGLTISMVGSDDPVVRALAVFDDGSGGGPALYAGGDFFLADGMPVNSIAKWDGTKWSPLGSGIGGDIPWLFALTVFDDGSGPALYAGGSFTEAGGVSAAGIAKWDGTKWSALGSGMDTDIHGIASVHAMAMLDAPASGRGRTLFAGGRFTAADGMPANYIASWQKPQQAAPADLNCDGAVDVQDLLILLAAWGPCPRGGDSGGCPADLNNSGAVDVQDLLILLANWG